MASTHRLTTARDVFDHHIRALSGGDLEGLLSDYSDDSVVIGPEGAIKGLAPIRSFFESILSGLLKPGTYEVALDTLHVDGDIVFVLWHAKCASADIPFAADTFVIKNGKIAVQTFAPKLEPRG